MRHREQQQSTSRCGSVIFLHHSNSVSPSICSSMVIVLFKHLLKMCNDNDVLWPNVIKNPIAKASDKEKDSVHQNAA